MKGKKLVIVTDAWHPQVNGVVVCIDAIMPILRAQGYEVEVVHPGMFFSVPFPLYREIRLALFAYPKLRTILAASGADYIHLATEGPLGWMARHWCLKQSIPFTTSYHTHFAYYIGAWFHARLIPIAMSVVRRFHAPAALTFVAGPDLHEELQQYGFDHLALWPLGVDTVRFTRDLSGTLPHMAQPVFCYLGRISREKNLEEFLQADLPGTKLVIGDGPLRKKLQYEYAGLALFAGYRRGHDLVRWLSRANVLVFPSRTDTFGLVILEALACGVPVAAHDVVGPRSIITNGVDGVLHEDLAVAATEALKLSSEKCRAKALHFSWEASAQAFVRGLVPAHPVPAGSLATSSEVH